MDLLGSILGSMDPIPAPKLDDEAKKRIQEAKASANKFKDIERRRKADFKARIEAEINKFLESPTDVKKLVFEPMDKLHRSITHDVAETAGIPAYSFGEEEVDRHMVVWKNEYSPSEAELQAMRNGEEYDPEKIASGEKEKVEAANDEEKRNCKRNNPAEVEEKYFEKYAKIVGENSGIDAAHATKSNKAYGMVPSSNKQDTRSIEETMKQIRQRKLERKTVETPQQEQTATTSNDDLTKSNPS